MINKHDWPELNFANYQDTYETLHHWLQIVGKIRLRTMPWQNHSWHTALYVTPHGYSTHGIPYDGRIFQIDFNFVEHKLTIECTGTRPAEMELKPMTVADFYGGIFERLEHLNIHVKIHNRPNEMEDATPFHQNTKNKTYDPAAANTLWRAMLCANGVFNTFRSSFVGKSSPVHLFWGAFDLAVTRFSGEPAPLHPGLAPNMPVEVMQEAYSQEVSSAGFWPGSAGFPKAAFYAYAYPTHADFGKQHVQPAQAYYSQEMGEFFLDYDDVRQSDDPEQTLLAFLQTTYDAAVNTSGWERSKLEKA